MHTQMFPDAMYDAMATVQRGLEFLVERHPVAPKAIAQAIENNEFNMKDCMTCAVGSVVHALALNDPEGKLGCDNWGAHLRAAGFAADVEECDYGFVIKDQLVTACDGVPGAWDVLDRLWSLAVLHTTHPDHPNPTRHNYYAANDRYFTHYNDSFDDRYNNEGD